MLHCVGGSVLAVEPHGVSPADRQVPASGKCTTMRAICCLVASPSFPCKPDHHTNGPPHPPPPRSSRHHDPSLLPTFTSSPRHCAGHVLPDGTS